MIVGMIACSLAWSATQASLVMEDGERRRLDEPLSTCGGAVSKVGELESAALAGRPVVRLRAPRPDTELLAAWDLTRERGHWQAEERVVDCVGDGHATEHVGRIVAPHFLSGLRGVRGS